MTQTEAVLDYMVKHKTITQKEADDELGISRLAARIADLKAAGFPIVKTNKRVVSRYGKTNVAEYSLAQNIQPMSESN